MMSSNDDYVYEGCVVGERGLERMAKEAVLKSTESDDKLNEEEVQSMTSGKSKSTAKSTPEDWFNHLNQDVQGHNKFAGYDGLCPYSLLFFFLLVKIRWCPSSPGDWCF